MELARLMRLAGAGGAWQQVFQTGGGFPLVAAMFGSSRIISFQKNQQVTQGCFPGWLI